MTRNQIIKKIGNPHLSLHAGKGYFYFVYDKSDREFDERSVYTMRLNDLSLDRWVEEGKELLNEVGAWPATNYPASYHTALDVWSGLKHKTPKITGGEKYKTLAQ